MKIIESNGVYRLAAFSAAHETCDLPVGNYLVKYDPREGYSLQRKENFILPTKIYGDTSMVKRWLHSWEHNSEKNMGVILSGIKGNGKTITAQKLCVDAKMPVIMVTEPYSGSDFVDFMTSFTNVIIFIDEFEKIYQKQELSIDLLGMMDGNYPTKMIFILTVNEFTINSYLINRLNRVKYREHYESLSREIMDEVIDDLLINKAHRESIYTFFKKVNMCTFDLLVNIIKEMNLFQEDALTCGKYLNLNAEKKVFDIYEHVDGKLVHQSGVSLGGDQTEFTISRSELTKEQKSLVDEKQIENVWEFDVNLDECNIVQTEAGLVIGAKDESYKFLMKERRVFSNFAI